MQPKTRVLIFPFDLLSHYLRCIVLSNQYYNSDNYEVLFLSSTNYDKFVELHGYKTFSCKQFDSKTVMALSEKFDFSWLNVPAIETVFLAQVAAIKLLQPAIVIGDVAPSLKMAAELTHVEYVTLSNGYLTKYYALPRKLSITHKAYKYSKKLPEKYFDKITRYAEQASFYFVHRPFKQLRKKYHLKKVADYLSEIEGDRNLICDLPLLFPQKDLPPNYIHIGPLIYKSAVQEYPWLKNIKPPVICICMGSTGNWEKLSFLNDPKYARYTIVTAGDCNKKLNAPHISGHEFLNLEQVLEAAQLLICHGGNGTIYYGLMKGVYMLCLTSHFEQEWNVHALERIGYGRSANTFTLNEWETQIRDALTIQLKPYF